MAEHTDAKQIDKRTMGRQLSSGALDDKTLERLMKNLPDVADKAVTVDTVMEDETFEDDHDEDSEDTAG